MLPVTVGHLDLEGPGELLACLSATIHSEMIWDRLNTGAHCGAP
jgi:hypothetical protein